MADFDTIYLSTKQSAPGVAVSSISRGKCAEAGESCTIVNSSLTATAFLADNNSALPNDPNGITPLGPLNSVSFDGSQDTDTWAVADVGATITLLKYPQGSNWSASPVQAAQQLATSGIPLLNGFTAVYTQTLNLPANGSANTGNQVMAGPGYRIVLNSTVNPASINPFVQITVQWYDPTGLVVVARQDWIIASNTAGNLSVFGEGPVRSGVVKVTCINLDTANSQTIGVRLFSQTGHISRDDWRQIFNPAPPQWQYPAFCLPSENLLGSEAVSSPNASLTRLLPLYAGQAFLSYELTPTVAGNYQLFVNTVIPSSGGAIYQGPIATSAAPIVVQNIPITLPRIPCELTVSGAAANFVIDFALVIMEYAS